MSAFDADLWVEARELFEGPLPGHPSDVDREMLASIACGLRGEGWSFGDIALALGQSKSTVYRSVNGPEAGVQDESHTPGGGPAAIVVGLIGAAPLAYLFSRRPPQEGGPP